MTSRKRHLSSSSSSVSNSELRRSEKRSKGSHKNSRKKSRRQHILETLEARQLLAGPQLIGIQPNEGDLIVDGSVRNTAPSVLTFRFDENQQINADTLDGIRITRPGADGIFQTPDDIRITPGLVTVGDPNENEVVVRFAESLPDDNYRVEVYGFDDPGLGIQGLRNVDNEFLVPRTAGDRSEVLNFSLRLGALVEAVVPQPVVRLADGSLQQNRNEIVVYFNEDPLFVENDDAGNPTLRSAEHPRFYQLLLTEETARTTDDRLYHPDTVVYDATTHTARLFFADDLNNLPGVSMGGGTFRLRVGTAVDSRADLIIEPTDVVVAPIAVTDFGVAGLRVSFVSKLIGESASGRQVRFEDVGAAGLAVRAEADGTVVFNFGGDTPTVNDLNSVVLSTPAVAALIEVKWSLNGDSSQGGSTPVPRSQIGAPPLVLNAVGDTLGTALDVGVFGADGTLTSLVFKEAIDPQPFAIQLPGGNNDPGHSELDEVVGGLLQHINDNFGPDTQNGITEIAYNFNPVFDTSVAGVQFQNQITERQKVRIREALGLWASKIGVQFRETASDGITFALGETANLQAGTLPGTSVVSQNVINARVRIDPTFTEPALVFSNQVTFNTAYGEDFLRKATAGIGLILGLEQTPDLPSQTLMSLNSTFLNSSINGRPDQEPVFPGSFDVLHGQFVHRPDSNDIDLYRFQVDLNDADRVGNLTAETFAERLPDSSLLDTTLTLYQEIKASAVTDFGYGVGLQVRIDSLLEGLLGNNLRLDFILSDRQPGDTAVRVTQPNDSSGKPIANAILVELPRKGTNVPTLPVSEIIDAINNSPFASSIMRASLVTGAASTDVSSHELTFSPILLSGGGLVQLSRNDDYFSEDSRLTASLGEGTYYVGIAASGNDNYDPTIPGSGYGGLTQGKYELHLKFEPQVDETDVIRDLDSERTGVPGTILDGDGDGSPGGVHNFWFQTRPLNRTLTFTDNGDALTVGQTIKITGAAGVVRTFEFVPINGSAKPGNVAVFYSPGSPNFPTPAGTLASTLQTAINGVANKTGVTATISNGSVILSGERSVELSTNSRALEASGRNIFVDKTAGPNADGSLDHPFNNISNSNVANAFDAALPKDIVRIVGNGGVDGDLSTVEDNLSYKIGVPDVGGGFLEDGRVMEVPKEVTTMIDAGAAFKLRQAYIGVGSSTVQVDRSNGVLQILGTPRLVDLSDPNTTLLLGDTDRERPAFDDGSVIFTSFRDLEVDRASVGNSPAVSPGNWGGLLFRQDIDQAEGRQNLEDQGIFMNRVNHAEIRYGGSSNLTIDSMQQLVNPIEIVNMRPTISFSEITNSADAAMSATPDSFEETSYQSPQFQQAGAFTADYDRVGPEIHNNQLFDNSINGLYVRVVTTSTEPPRALTVASRFDDTSVVHYIAENIVIASNPGGSIQDGFAPSTSLISAQMLRGGTFNPGDYLYKMTFVDADGFESAASVDPFGFTVSSAKSSIELTGLPQVQSNTGYVSRRLYRAIDIGGTPVYRLVAELDASSISYIDNGSSTDGVLDLSLNGVRGRLDASLVIDPGTVVKLRGARFELGYGTQLLAEGTESNPVVFTSVFDDRFGAGGTFDTNNDSGDTDGGTDPNYGDWSGIYAGPTSTVSLDHATVAYGGGISLLEGGQSRGFNALELHQAEGRVTNSRFEFNEDGQDGAGPAGRFGRLINNAATIFVRGAQPIIVGTTFTDNRGSIIDIDSESMTAERVIDAGRQTGTSDRLRELDDNYGPMIRFNRYEDTATESDSTERQLSGLEIRGGTLTTESVWDDTDIVHMLFDSLVVENFHSSGGLRLMSRLDESLVVKLLGSGNPNSATTGTGLTATGSVGEIEDRIGGAIHIIGQPGAPVVLTSLLDDTVGAGLTPDGSQFTDTNGDGIQSRPAPNDWRSIFLDQYSNDRNVDVIKEFELPSEEGPGLNGDVEYAQYLGELAPNLFSGDENRRHGFEVDGYLTDFRDIDTYSFDAAPGTEIWVDIDYTTYRLDTVIELLDENGQVLARSDNSFAETSGNASVVVLDSNLESSTTSLQASAEEYTERGAGGLYDDFGSTNPRDAGIHFTLPGNAADPTARSKYFFRVRSASLNPDDMAGGLTYGGYRFQLRLTEAQEFPGSVVRYTDIRYANNGIHTRGLPSSSPLIGEAGENEALVGNAASNDQIVRDGTESVGQRAQNIGNLVGNKNNVISVAGSLSSGFDVDFYQFDIDYSLGNTSLHSTVFDIDYADGFNRPNTSVSVFYDPDGETGGQLPRLVLYGQDANILDDLTSPNGENSALEKLLRGSIGTGDAFIGPVSLPEGSYYVAVTADGREPVELTSNSSLRREPINSVHRIVEDRINPSTPSTARQADLIKLFSDATLAAGGFVEADDANPGHGKPAHFDRTQGAPGAVENTSLYYNRMTATGAGTITSDPFSLAGYVAADAPTFYYNYRFDPTAGDTVALRIFSDQDPTGSTLDAVPQTDAIWHQSRIPLDAFAGHSGVRVEITYTPLDAGGGVPVVGTSEGLYLDDFIVGFAERGETVFGATAGEDGFTGFGTGESGEYQLELRSGTQYATPTPGGTVLNLDFDTNDRHSETITIVAPAGDQIIDGDTFIISDGSVSQTFEFTTTAGTVRFGNTPVLFSAADQPKDIARSIRTAITTQTRIKVEASSAAGQDTGALTDGRLSLVGARGGSFMGVNGVADAPAPGTRLDLDSNGNLKLPVIFHQGEGDVNFVRRQSQVVIEQNMISDVHAIGIWNEPGVRQTDPEDQFGSFPLLPFGNPLPGVARNLPTLNNEVLGGLMPGVVIRNNTIDQAGYVGIKVEGETRPFMIETGDGDSISDGVTMAIDSGGTRVVFEFEDISGSPTLTSGSGVVGGDGVADGHVPIYYRRTHSALYDNRASVAYSSRQMASAIMQAIQGSILVTNNSTELVSATLGPSLTSDLASGDTAVYLSGVSNIYVVGRSGVAETPIRVGVQTQLAPVAEPLQPFTRIVNNTIYGADGTEALFPESGTRESNDTLAEAIDTKVGRSHVGPYVTTGTIGDNSGPIGAAGDVDFYRVEMQVGDRLIVDIDTGNTLDTVLQVFDARGVAQLLANGSTVVDTATAPGHLNPGSTVANPTADAVNERDPFVDFTALSTGTYFVAVSGKGNESFDPASLSGRELGTGGTGDYTISIENYTARSFVMSINGGSASDGGGVRGSDLLGTTFTVTQIPDVLNGTTNQVTFTFATGGGVGNVIIAANDQMPDIIEAIAQAINFAAGVNNGLLENHVRGNGPGGISGPIQRVSALALGGRDGNNASVATFNLTGDRASGFGHDRLTTPGDGTTELYAVINNVAKIELSAAARNAGLRLDPVEGRDTDQLLNETGIMIAGGASPAILNNVLVNLHESVVIEETNLFGFGQFSNSHVKPMDQDTVVVGSVFQFDQPEPTSFNDEMTFLLNGGVNNGISTGINEPSNLNGGSDDFNVSLGNNAAALQYPGGNNFLPIGNSVLVDSGVNSLIDRDKFKTLKASVGIAASNVLAPIRDVNGVFRADNPSFQPPGTVGESVFRDRGSNELADFVGPVATAEFPRDNGVTQRDGDPAVSFINLSEGAYKEFRILLRDNGDASDPFYGIGIDDNTVVVPAIPGLRPSGSNVTVFENDRMLIEGIDYTFHYAETKNLITLKPLTGIWQEDRSYRVALNQRDRTVLVAPEAQELTDGDQIKITDANGGDIVFEFETGYQLLLPETISLIVPQVGTNFGGVSDGDIFQINDGKNPVVVFELDSDGVRLPSSVVVALPSDRPPTDPTALAAFLNQIALNIQTAIDAEVAGGRLDVETRVIGSRVAIGAEPGATAITSGSGLLQDARTLAFRVPEVGSGFGGVVDGDTFIVNDGIRAITFEFNTGGGLVDSANTEVAIATDLSANQVAIAIQQAILASSLRLNPNVQGDSVYLNLPDTGSASVPFGQLTLVGISRTPTDGDLITFSPSDGSDPVTIEINRTDEPNDILGVRIDDGVTAPNIPVNITRSTTASELADLILAAIQSTRQAGVDTIAGLDTSQVSVINGTLVSIGGSKGLGLGVTGTSLEVVGAPDVTGSSTIEVFGPLLLNLPLVGGGGFQDGSVLILRDALGNDVVFEFNLVNTLQAVPGAIPVTFNTFDTVDILADSLVAAINASSAGVTAQNLLNGRITLGRISADRVELTGIPADPDIPGSGAPGVSQISVRRGIVNDGEVLTLRQGTTSISLEFESVNNGGGVRPGNIAIPFQPTSTIGDIAVSLAAAINNNRGNLSITATADLDLLGEPIGTVSLDDLPGTVVDASQAPTLNVVGVPGGAIPISIDPDFTAEQVKLALLQAINNVNREGQPALTNLAAEDRGGATLFIENGQIFEGPVSTFYLPGIKDKVGNPLEPNRQDQTTQFTFMLPSVGFDFGDAPDPVNGVPGRYPTTLASDGPRHVVDGEIMLGSKVDVDVDGMPSRAADGDDATILASSTGTLFTVAVVDGRVEVTVNTAVDAATRDGDTITIDTGADIATLEFDINGRFEEDNFAIRPVDNTPESIAAAIAQAIQESPLRPAGVSISGNLVIVDGNDEDGVSFVSNLNPQGILNRGVGVTRVDGNGQLIRDNNGNPVIFLPIQVTGTGVLDAWIDFAADGDFTDVGDQIITSAILNGDGRPQTFYVPFPAHAPDPVTATDTYARFRVSRNGGLEPIGLALSGEVQDYRLRLLPGTPPMVGDQQANLSYSTDEDQQLQATDVNGLLSPGNANDNSILVGVTDADGDDIAVYPDDVGVRTIMVSGEAAGVLDLQSDGTFTFVPAQDFNGPVTFSARVTDVKPLSPEDQLLSGRPISVTINVQPVNDLPVATTNNVVVPRTIAEDAVTTFTKAELIDPFYVPGPANEASQPLIIQSVGSVRGPFLSALGGVIAISADGRTVTYTPPADYNGPDSDTFFYSVADVPGAGQTSETAIKQGTVSISFTKVNDPPRLVNDTFTTQENEPLSIPLRTADNQGILDNDTAGPTNETDAPESQTISLVTAEFPKRTFRGGNVVFEGGSLRYTPPAQFSGVDQFSYTVSDDLGLTSSALVIINVGGVNDAPQFIGINGDPNETSLTLDESKADARTVQYDLSTWFSDPENDDINFSVTSSNTSIISAAVSGDTLLLTLPPFAFGQATLNITAVDPSGATVVTPIPVTVTDTPDPPTLVGTLDPLSGVEDVLVTADLGSVFADPDGEPLTYSVARIGNIVNPTPTQIAQNPLVQAIRFVGDELQIELKPNQSGSVEIEIAARDGNFRISDAFTLTVAPTPDAPVAANDAYNVPVGTKLQVLNPANGLLRNDSDADGDTLSIDPASVTPSDPNFVLNADGTFTFTAQSGAVGDTVTFSYNVVDSTGLPSNTATVTFTFNQSRYQNPISSLVTDVNADGSVSALDALRIINLLDQRLTGQSSSIPVADLGAPPPDYYDVSGDGRVSAFDALLVINALELRGVQPMGSGESVAEGEIVAANASPSNDANFAASVSFASASNANLPVRNAVAVAEEPSIETVDPRDAILQAGFEIGRSSVENAVDSFGPTLANGGSADSSSVDEAFASLLDDSLLEGGLQ
ncbi:hypothetical protein Pla52o_14380 [Novipirellula galeiformis]|uniref:Dockerin type I repeat protein n=1 Tax=Novipirellula galeiformis TaxID=2528004 RepID=A0A5C6CKL6_9BACT|nr:tandem-95 repeat protein [Novipirellula galeiformis]TWU25140.1 hypothetical protein Pla52o_14380 [Novipirellula galeiformis]